MRHLARTILLTVMVMVAGCGGGADHNAQDVSFAKDMVPHHQQAVTMSDLAVAQAGDPRVKELATRIKAAQGPEIATMNGWLASWGEQAVDHSGHDMGAMTDMAGMKGMLSDSDMAALRGASGAGFDRLFLQGMTAHHQGAVDMARAEIDKGKFEPARAMARQIAASQEKEIAEMAQILGTLA